jgi:head-tail adaptor
MRKRGRIQYLPKAQLSQNPNAFNEPDLVGGWRTLVTVWFNLRPITGRELWYAGQITGDATHLIECRFVPGVTPAMRLAYSDPTSPDPNTGKLGKARFFNFDHVEDLEERHIELAIQCHESV